jgi:hypothetical protein
MAWWVYRGQGDPGQLRGAMLRAEGTGSRFIWKFRQFVKMGLDHALF